MLKSLQLLKSGFRGSSLSSSSGQSQSQDSKPAPSELKKKLVERLKEQMRAQGPGGTEEKMIISLVTQALISTSEERLIEVIRIAHVEFGAILAEFAPASKENG